MKEPTVSKEAPIVSFRVPLHVVEMLINKGVLTTNYNKTELSRIAREELFRAAGADIEAPINVENVYRSLGAVEHEVTDIKKDLDDIKQNLKTVLKKILEGKT